MGSGKAPTPPVRDVHVHASTSVAALVEAFGQSGGFTARRVAEAAQVLARMRKEKARVILSFPAAVMATGLRGVIVDLVRDGYVDAVVTTCGTLDHDLARTWGAYHHGAFEMDDAQLAEEGFHRLGNVLVPAAAYGPLLEKRLRPAFRDYFSATPRPSTADFSRYLGQLVEDHEAREASLLWTARQRDVPVFVPGPTDGAVGSQVWMAYQSNRQVGFDLMADEQALSDLVMEAPKLGALIIGGGISKHHVIWWAQFREGLDYAVAVTTAVEHDGSLSGARLREAISWGKLKAGSDHVTVDGDATVILPLLSAAWRASP